MTIPEFSKLISLPPARVLTTAEILYHMPDHPDLLQTFIWQHFDILPDFPALRRFLVYWEKNLDGPIHSVTVCRAQAPSSRILRHSCHYVRLH